MGSFPLTNANIEHKLWFVGLWSNFCKAWGGCCSSEQGQGTKVSTKTSISGCIQMHPNRKRILGTWKADEHMYMHPNPRNWELQSIWGLSDIQGALGRKSLYQKGRLTPARNCCVGLLLLNTLMNWIAPKSTKSMIPCLWGLLSIHGMMHHWQNPVLLLISVTWESACAEPHGLGVWIRTAAMQCTEPHIISCMQGCAVTGQ